MQSGLFGTTSVAPRFLSAIFKSSRFGRIASRGMGSRATDGNRMNSRNSLTGNEQRQPRLWDEDDFPPLSAGTISSPAGKRKTRIDVNTRSPSQRKSNDDQQIGSLQPSANHQYDTDLPANFGKKHTPMPSPSYRKSRGSSHERGRPKRALVASPSNTKDEPFDICFPESKPHREFVYEKICGKEWVSELLLDDEDYEQEKGDRKHIVDVPGRVLRSGMVLFKHYIPISEQVDIVKRCRELGCGPGGFYRPGYEDGAKLRLYMMCLGQDWNPQTRKYDNIRQYDNVAPPDIPREFASLVSRALYDSHALFKRGVNIANVEDTLPAMSPDVGIVNFYTTNGRLGLHQDRDESKESLTKGLPVVSVSIGDSADFLYGDNREVNKAESILLESGDVLIFGGQSRHIFHGVETIIPNTAPCSLLKQTRLKPGRLNLTFRKY